MQVEKHIIEHTEFNRHQSYKILRELKANTRPSLISRINNLGSAFGIIFPHFTALCTCKCRCKLCCSVKIFTVLLLS